MASNKAHLSVTIRTSLYEQLEKERKKDGETRSQAVDEAIETWLRLRDESRMKQGCLKEASEDRDIAKAAKKMASKNPME